MALVLREDRKSQRCSTGGGDHTRSSLLVVQMDAALVSTAAVASSRPREDAEGPHQHGTEHSSWGGPYNEK